MVSRIVAAILFCVLPSLALAGAPETGAGPDEWHGAYWYGTFENQTQLQVTIKPGPFSCWYSDQFDNPNVMGPNSTTSIFSAIEASWPNCYYADHYFQFFYLSVPGFNTVTGLLRAEPLEGGDHSCFTTINGVDSSSLPCHPSGPLASQVWYSIQIVGVRGVLGAVGTVTRVNSDGRPQVPGGGS